MFIILINISMFHTIIPSVLFGNLSWYYHQLFIVFINIAYLIWNSKILFINKIKINSTINLIIIILISIYLLEIPRYLIKGLEGRSIILTLLNAFTFLSFSLTLNTIYLKQRQKGNAKTALITLIKPYIYFSIFIASISVIVFFLAKLNFIDLFSNPAPSGLSTYMDNNAETLHTRYFTPLFITIISAGARGTNFFMDTAIFSGISHEPHIATYLMTPALFMMYGIKTISVNKKIIFSAIFFVFFLIASSLTNLLVLVTIGVIYLLKLSLVNKRAISTLFIVSILVIVAMTTSFEALGLNNILLKINNSGGSKDYSLHFINYILTPATIWGDGVFNVPYPYAKVDNIGFIFSVLIILFYAFGYLASAKAIFQSNKLLQFVGLATLYFFLHSLKIIQLIFIYPFTVFILVILVKAFEVNKTPNQ